MKQLAALVLLLAACFAPLATRADVPPAQYTLVNATTTTTVSARVFYGIVSLATQATVLTCYDSATLSGTIIYQNTPTAATAIGAPAVGIALTSGSVTCAIATSVVAPGYLIASHT